MRPAAGPPTGIPCIVVVVEAESTAAAAEMAARGAAQFVAQLLAGGLRAALEDNLLQQAGEGFQPCGDSPRVSTAALRSARPRVARATVLFIPFSVLALLTAPRIGLTIHRGWAVPRFETADR